MRKTLLSFAALILSLHLFSAELVLIPTGSIEKTKELFSNKKLVVNFYNDQFAVATTESSLSFECIRLDNKAWADAEMLYFILFFDESTRENYINDISAVIPVLYQGSHYLVVSIRKSATSRLYPAIHGGMIRITHDPARLPGYSLSRLTGNITIDSTIFEMIAQVDTVSLHQKVKHLQDFGTRNAYKSQGVQAQNWIFNYFDSLGLDVELYDFYMPGGSASDNVIVTLTGTKYPDEYIVLGAHYDSYAGGNQEPGADDNATGTAGIMEAARILSQYQFDRSIIFATWSGEEYGLYGSDAWVTEAANDGMNILGYFNIDMAGYLESGSPIHTDIIAPASASELADFYIQTCNMYVPALETGSGFLSGGDSDHTSFNNNGYMGIFPFEDSQDCSPYIHTANDLIGPSVNNFEQHGLFVQATIASVARMADMLPSPSNLAAIAGDEQVELSWEGIDSVDHYNIYRNDTAYATSTDASYIDNSVTNGVAYSYFVTAIFMNNGEESDPSNEVTVIPMPPIALPFYDDYETGAPYWTFEGTWGLKYGTFHSASNSITESPDGNYTADLEISCYLRALNLNGYTSAEASFWTKFQLQNGYDFMYFEVSTNGNLWQELGSFTGNQNNWSEKSYSLNSYLNNPNVQFRFRFKSNLYIQADGMYIDDFEVNVDGVGISEPVASASTSLLQNRPNPFRETTSIGFTLAGEDQVLLNLYDINGKHIRTLLDTRLGKGSYTFDLNASELPGGIYYYTLETQGQKLTKKLSVVK